MSKESGFVPISEANTKRIRFAFDLPSYVDSTSVRANPELIEKWMNLGGISSLNVEFEEGDRVSESAIVAGVTPEGSAYMGKMSSSTKSEYDVDSQRTRFGGSPQRAVTVKLDVNKITESGATENVRSPHLWARKIDKGIAKGIRETGRKVLLKDNVKGDLMIIAGSQAGNAFTGFNGWEVEIPIYMLTSVVINVFRNNMGLGERRFSFILGPQ